MKNDKGEARHLILFGSPFSGSPEVILTLHKRNNKNDKGEARHFILFGSPFSGSPEVIPMLSHRKKMKRAKPGIDFVWPDSSWITSGNQFEKENEIEE